MSHFGTKGDADPKRPTQKRRGMQEQHQSSPSRTNTIPVRRPVEVDEAYFGSKVFGDVDAWRIKETAAQ